MALSLRVPMFGCSHLIADKKHGRDALAIAMRDYERPAFGSWDLAFDHGDHTDGTTDSPNLKDGQEFVRQRAALSTHKPEDVYSCCGNEDRERAGEMPGWWFRKFVDPLGEFTTTSGIVQARRPFALASGAAWNRYEVKIGNLVFLVVSDVVRPASNLRGVMGGDPGGVVAQATFDWWKARVEAARSTNEIVVTIAHYLPKNTTVATTDYGGGTINAKGIYVPVYHGPGLDPRESGRLGYVGEAVAWPFSDHLAAHPGDCAMWGGAHTHAAPGATVDGRGLRVFQDGCHYVNDGHLTKYHGLGVLTPRSRVFTFTHGQSQVSMQTWYHTDASFHGSPEVLTLAKQIAL